MIYNVLQAVVVLAVIMSISLVFDIIRLHKKLYNITKPQTLTKAENPQANCTRCDGGKKYCTCPLKLR